MPGIPMQAATSTPVKKQDNMASTPASEKHMVAGRRKLDEFRKKRADLKSKATVKPNSTDVHSEGLANGPNPGLIIEGNGRQIEFANFDAQPASGLKEKVGKILSQASQLEQSRGDESQDTRSISKDTVHGGHTMPGYIPTSAGIFPSDPEGDSVVKVSEDISNSSLLTSKISPQNYSSLTGGHRQVPWMEGTREAETRVGSRKSILGHTSDDNYDPLVFHRKESETGVFSDGVLPSRAIGNSWNRPTENLRRGSSHESFSLVGQDTDIAASVLSLVPSGKDGTADSMQEGMHQQPGSSWLPNGRRSWDSKEAQFFSQPKKLPFVDRTEREPLFQPSLFEKPPFPLSSTVAAAALTPPSSMDHQESISLLRSLPEQTTKDAALDKSKELKTRGQQEGKQKPAKDDDFSALEQHIDDLTQEKFGLQRALDVARSLADSLSHQNSNLTEDFNAQGGIINQLQEELEKKKEEVTAQSLVLSSLMMERERAQQENNSAVERSQILAGEVIGLEEKVLRLRSSELKLQKELETLKAASDSFRVQVATLDKDRKNLQTLFDALQEDKKLLQNQLQKAFTGTDSTATGSAKEVSQRNSMDSRDPSTATENSGLQTHNGGTVVPVEKTEDEAMTASMVVSLPNSMDVSLPSVSSTFSPDEYRAIDGIDKLITELFSEKEALVHLLQRESARATQFEAANYDLTKKLETQTQRLELAVAQNMAFGGNAVTALNTTEIEPEYNAYVDEGDEVVERVLGWIMRIFPGGSSRRQSSKRL